MYPIALVVDESFGKRLVDVARSTYVWIVESVINDPWARRLWEEPRSSEDPLLRGVSSFARYPGETMDELIIRLLEMIEEHHGEVAHDPEWSEINVLGASQSMKVTEAARIYGVDKIEPTPEGFRLIRSTRSPCPSGNRHDPRSG